MSDKTSPTHYKKSERIQIWDYFGVLNGTQSNILKYLTRIGQGESIADDKAKIISYAENHLRYKLDINAHKLTGQQITNIYISIIRHICRFSNSAYAQDLCYAVLCQDYNRFIDMVNNEDRFNHFVNSQIHEH